MDIFKIKNFGADRSCKTVSELKEMLETSYQGKSVSVEYPGPSGINQILYVDVDQAGIVRESYGDQKLVVFSDLDVGTH